MQYKLTVMPKGATKVHTGTVEELEAKMGKKFCNIEIPRTEVIELRDDQVETIGWVNGTTLYHLSKMERVG